MGARENDAIRQVPKTVAALTAKVSALEELIREDHKYMKELLRSIKKATVRKYGKDDETEPVDPADNPPAGDPLRDNMQPVVENKADGLTS